jgi:hypothetical protein
LLPLAWVCGGTRAVSNEVGSFFASFLFTKRRRFLQPLTLATLHARVLLVNHVHATTATNDAAVLVADFGSLQAVTDLHVE